MSDNENSLAGESSATRSVYFAIQKLILSGDISPGEKLKIESLRSRFNMGASPIREALSLLTSDLLVERIDQRGFRAAVASKANFEEILNLRCVMEEMALRNSIKHGDAAWEEELILCHHRMKQAQNGKRSDFEDYHKAFHMALLAGCGSPLLLRYCSQLYDLNVRYRNIAWRSDAYSTRNVDAEHQAILEAAIEREEEAAVERILSHYRLTGAYLESELHNVDARMEKKATDQRGRRKER